MGYLPWKNIKPASPVSNGVPPQKVVSMTQVITPESPAAYSRALKATGGSPVDHTMLQAEGRGKGYTFPGWVGLSTQMVIPGSSRGDSW